MPIPDNAFMFRSLEFLAKFFIFFIGLCALAIVVRNCTPRNRNQMK